MPGNQGATMMITDEMVETGRRVAWQQHGVIVGIAELRAILEAALAASPHNDGWQPIETAPKDGSQFLIWTKRLGFAVVTHDTDDPMPTEIVPSGHHLMVDDGKHGPYPIRGDYPTKWLSLAALPTPNATPEPAVKITHPYGSRPDGSPREPEECE